MRISTSFSVVLVLSAVVCLAAAAEHSEGSHSVVTSDPVVIKTQGFIPFADAPINYRSQALNDPIAKLEKRLERGEIVLHHDPKFGYLRSVLDALHIPASSQTLVFSKTSFQFPDITPANPRALYYNDDVYVGRVHSGKFLEFVSFDPTQGAIFYIMDERATEHPRFERSEVDCLQCHVAQSTHGVPGVMLRSVFTAPSGYQAAGTPSFITGQESPLKQRWGGWYVTADKGPKFHMGNATVSNPKNIEAVTDVPANRSSLNGLVNTTPYLTGTSDIVALMVLAHQTQMHNLITETSYKTRLALYAEVAHNKAAGLPEGTLSDAARKQLEDPAERLIRYLLFTNEVRLQTPIIGSSTFAEDFAARGRRDAHGRSLRDFDLHTRIFKYPCSYLVYSDDFDAIPAPAKDYIYRRLFEVLSGRDQSPGFASVSNEDRRAILEILVATKPGLPDEWKQFVQKANHGEATAPRLARLNKKPNLTERNP